MCGPSATPTPESVRPETTSAARTELRAYIPDAAICNAAFELVTSTLPLSIVHHSLRVYLFAQWLAEKEASEWADSEALFVACICHDLGASQQYNGSQRFEIEGADAAAELFRRYGKPEAIVHEVWTAIALHTSPGIAERITSLARLVRIAVLIDFRPATREALGAVDYAMKIEMALPRLDIEKVLGDAVVQQAIQNPQKAPAASWPNNLYKSYLEDPDWTGVNRAF